MAQATLVKPGTRVHLADHDPDYCAGLSKHDAQVAERLAAARARMAQLQGKLYAESRQSLLVVLQARDAAGKDGTIRNVMRGVNPQGCSVVSFKVPTEEELAHDFLWRVHRHTPRQGQIMVFNRSHYEDVLAVRVRKLAPPKVWRARYEHINAFERLLADRGTRILKLYLHISADEQIERLQARLDDPTKHWKFNPGDLKDRELWGAYTEAYEEALTRCSTDHAPWHIIPANRKWYRNVVVAELLADTLREMKPRWPKPDYDPATIVLR